MDYMQSGMRYTPRPDKEWDTSVQFLPASDSKKLEKKKGLGRIGAVIGVVVFAAVLALMTGLLVWHFHFRKDVREKRLYTGSMRITNQVFEEKYENSNSSEFKALAKQVADQLKTIYSKTPQLSKYYVGSTVQAFSEGVTAYYLSEFNVPVSQGAAVDAAMGHMDQLVAKNQRTATIPGNALVFEDVVSSALDERLLTSSSTRTYNYAQHAKSNRNGIIESPGFPNTPYPPNSFIQWRLRADPGHVIKLDFDTFNLEENCKNDFVKIYDSLVAIESSAMEELCGYYSPSDPLTFLSSRNVMLVTLVTNKDGNYPGIRAHVSQVRKGGPGMKCGGDLKASQGSFTSPNFPNYYPPNANCKWTIEVPAGKSISFTFNKFLLLEPGQGNRQDCPKDYVSVNSKKLCGDKASEMVEMVSSNSAVVKFISDGSYVDRGFNVTFKAINSLDPCPNQFQCKDKRCLNLTLQCDGWNDCGDMSDETGCTCKASAMKCRNGFCKAIFWRCDGIDDCGDKSDELDCGSSCRSSEFRCQNEKCVLEKKKCDGRDDCGDGSDELDCGRTSNTVCTELSYKCKNKECVNKVNPECDGETDCADGSDEQNCDCGHAKIRFKTSRIVGGQDANPGEFPWQVSLHVKGYGHVCGATVISPRWLVTAAHCVQDDPRTKKRYSQPGTWEAFLGLQTQGEVGEFVAKRNLKRIIPHPYYNEFTYDNDIALMELDGDVAYNNYIQPICLPSEQHQFPVGASVWVTGWGATREGGSAAPKLQKAEVRIINQTVCNTLMANQLTSRMQCAGVLTGGTDACQGDSGGPLSSPSKKEAGMFLSGVVSWGDGCARRNKPGIYSRVTKFRPWIKQHTGV